MQLRRLLRLFAALALALLLFPSGVLAQDSNWRERRTDRFAILYSDGDEATAEHYAGFVDAIYDEVAAIFGHHTDVPITLKLYPTLERYYEVNPLARGLEGVVAHADFRHHEVVVIVPQTRSQTSDEIQNNIRHELTHIVAAELSDDRLNVGFQEGVAQYVEHPSRELETKIRLLRRASDTNGLMSWSDLDDRDNVYQNADVSYPQSLSIVAFLVERYSFAKLREMLTITARSSGYRSALERTFGVTPDDLERQWRDWLPSYLAGGYRHNALTAYDLSRAEDLLRQGRYAEAQTELETAIEWLRTTEQPTILQQAQELLEHSAAGLQAESLAREARAALEAADYTRGADLVEQAQSAYAALGDTRQNAVLADYAQRAERGKQAAVQLNEATALAEALRYPQARAVADRAAAEYLALGDRARADQALALRAILDQRQTLFGALLLLLGLVGVATSAVRRIVVREAEAW
jgi:peptidase MA superfamily protein